MFIILASDPNTIIKISIVSNNGRWSGLFALVIHPGAGTRALNKTLTVIPSIKRLFIERPANHPGRIQPDTTDLQAELTS
jgi:hypothetical protein